MHRGAKKGSDRVSALACQAFGEDPAGIWYAPGRVNLIGEHIDYNGGVSVPMALPHATFAAVNPRSDRVIRAISAQTGAVEELDLDALAPAGQPSEVSGWMSYVGGVAKSLEDLDGSRLSGFDIAFDSCVPLGSGLSSSAALECALALAFTDLGCDLVGKDTLEEDEYRKILAAACVRAENVYAGAATGGMDQTVSLRAKEGHALAFDAKAKSANHIPFNLQDKGLEILVIDTRAEHSLVDGQYAARREASEAAAAALELEYLVDADGLSAVEALEDPLLKCRARHVVTETERTGKFTNALISGNLTSEVLEAVGKLMTESHVSLRDDYEVSCVELDLAVSTALDTGALGARMTGGGFGGSAIALVHKEDVPKVMGAVNAAFKDAGFTPPQFIEAIPAAGASKI